MSSAAAAKKRFEALSPGKTVAERYQVTRILGQGGMGQVLEVEHLALGRRFALKVLRLERWNDELVRRFNREARAAGSLTTPRVAQVTDFGVDPTAGPFYVMELLEGETLEDRLERDEKVPAREALAIGAELCEALADVHDAGIVHRDLKPSNVGLPASGPVMVKLLDFGLAASMDDAFLSKITQSQQILGSLPYMAPEQFNGASPASTMDLYAVGIVLYESLTGRLPFMAPSAAAMIHQILSVPMPALPADLAGIPHLEALLERFLAKEPAGRFSNARAAAQAIRDVLGRDAAAPITRMGMRPGMPPTGEAEASQRRSVGHMPTLMAESGTRLSGASAEAAPPTTPNPVSPYAAVHAVPPTPYGGTVPMPYHPPLESNVPVYPAYPVAPYPPAAPAPEGTSIGVRLAIAAIVGLVFAGLTAVAVAVGLSLLDDGSERPRPVATQPTVAQPTVAQPTVAQPTVEEPAAAEPTLAAPEPVADPLPPVEVEATPPREAQAGVAAREVPERRAVGSDEPTPRRRGRSRPAAVSSAPPPPVRTYTPPPPRPQPPPPTRDPSVIRHF
ncbi:MAG: protein kinase [Sandaracinaceae bacterium]|nr:protein kinase [Sandaracinaceae bacterium]